MKDYKVFDIIGPVMIGPSSSHTAGAARIAKTAASISEDGFDHVEFVLHGSFAQTYKGHGTDKALLAGALGFGPDDERLRNAYEIADEENMSYSFRQEDLGSIHPNSAKIIFTYPDGSKNSVIGSSIGGGNIEIVEINGVAISYTDEFPTFMLKYEEQKGVIYFVSKILTENDYNIESMKTVKNDNVVTLLIETTKDVDDKVVDEIIKDERFTYAKYISGVQ